MQYWGRQTSVYITGQTLAKRWSGLRIAFDIEHHRNREPNKAKIDIWGLSPSSRKLIKDEGKKLIVNAGYTVTGDIFVGDITKTTIVDRYVTKIEAGDGDTVTRERKVSVSLSPGMMLSDAFAQLSVALDVNIATVSDYTDVPFLTGLMMHGPVVFYLDAVCREMECDWWIQDGELVLLKAGYPVSTQAMVVSPETGLIGSPKELTKGDNGDSRVYGVGWTQLLDHRMRPGRLVQLESREHKGVYVTEKVRYVGDSGWNRDFYCEVESEARNVG